MTDDEFDRQVLTLLGRIAVALESTAAAQREHHAALREQIGVLTEVMIAAFSEDEEEGEAADGAEQEEADPKRGFSLDTP